MAILPKLIYRFNTIPIKIPAIKTKILAIFAEIDKLIPKFL